MAGVEALNFDAPDETRTPHKTKVDVVRTGGIPPCGALPAVARGEPEPADREPPRA